MTSYTIIAGDTFETIARKVYGSEIEASLISNANPGISEPLLAGTTVIIPARPGAPETLQPLVSATSENEVAVSIEKERFRFWSGLTLTRSMDTVDTLESSAPFEPSNADFKRIFTPFSYKPISVSVGTKPLFTGTILVSLPRLVADRKTVTVSGYSLPGVMNDTNIPASAFPLEFNGQGLQDIATTVARYFGLGVEFTDQQGPVFDTVAAEPTEKAFAFLTKLAQQRNFVISSTPRGKLLFQRSVSPGSPVARLSQGVAPLVSVIPQFKPQAYYSSITGLAPAVIGVSGSQHTVENPRLKGVIRPHTFKADDTDNGDVKEAVEAKMGRMFANSVKYRAELSTWRDTLGNLWEPNTTITLLAEGAMIYSEYEFIVRSVDLSRDEDRESAVLTLVLPGAFSGQAPEAMPWDQ